MSADTKKVASDERTDFFKVLCDNIEVKVALTKNTIKEILSFNQQASRHNLPLSFLLRLSITVSKLQRNFYDISSQIKELCRLTRLYAEPWERKVETFKVFHDKYLQKQLRLDTALKKLGNLQSRNDALERDRVIMNWQKMFEKLDCRKSAATGWRRKVSEVIQDTDISEFSDKKCCNASTGDHFNKDKLSLLNVVNEEGGRRSRKSSAYSERSQLLSSDSNVTIDELNVITPQQSVMEWLSLDENNSKIIEETNDKIIEQEFSYPKVIPKREGENKSTITENVNINQFLKIHVLKKFPFINSPAVQVTVTLGKEIIHRSIANEWCNGYKNDNTNSVTYTQGSEAASDDKLYEEFAFLLPDDFTLETTSEFYESTKLRIAFFPTGSEQMIAFAAVRLPDLTIYNQVDKELCVNKTLEKNFEILLKDEHHEISGTSLLKYIAFTSNQKQSRLSDQSTGTVCFADVVNEIIYKKRLEYQKTCQSISVETDEKPTYTQFHLNSLREELRQELNAVKFEYEAKIEKILQSHGLSSMVDVSQQSPVAVLLTDDQQESQHFHDPVKKMETAISNGTEVDSRKSHRRSNKYGKHLPGFYKRLKDFHALRVQYHHQLKETVENEIKEEITRKLNAARKIRINDSDLDSFFSNDSPLPALFMPMRQTLKRAPSGRSFLHRENQYRNSLGLEFPKVSVMDKNLIKLTKTES